MHFSAIVMLVVASLTAAMPFSSVEESPLTTFDKRRAPLCSAPYPRFTEARLADLIVEYKTSSKTFQLASGQQGDNIACTGGTGIILSVDAQSPVFRWEDIANDLNEGFKSCYGHYPSTGAGDRGFQPSFQYWGPGWNIVIAGSACG